MSRWRFKSAPERETDRQGQRGRQTDRETGRERGTKALRAALGQLPLRPRAGRVWWPACLHTVTRCPGSRNSRHCLLLLPPFRSQRAAGLTMKRALALIGLAFLSVLRAGGAQQTVDDTCSVQILVPGLKGNFLRRASRRSGPLGQRRLTQHSSRVPGPARGPAAGKSAPSMALVSPSVKSRVRLYVASTLCSGEGFCNSETRRSCAARSSPQGPCEASEVCPRHCARHLQRPSG